jgi:uncharacterized membrane protein
MTSVHDSFLLRLHLGERGYTGRSAVNRSAIGGVALAAVVLFANPALSTEYKCSGTEPFWGLEIGGTVGKFTSPEDADTPIRVKKTRTGSGTRADYLTVFEGRIGRARGRPMTVVVRGDSCSDGMSDTIYSHAATLITPSTVYVGCCQKK